MLRSESIIEITKALVAAQKEFESAIKNRIATVTMREGKGKYNFAYADLSMVIDATKEPLNNHGLAILQAVHKDSEKPAMVETMLFHESGEFFGTVTPLYGAVENNPQSFGTAISYTRRYALKALLNLPEEDETEQQTPQREIEKPVDLTPEQMDFCEKVRVQLEENLDGKKVDGPKLRDYFIASAKRQGKPVPSDDKFTTVTVKFILAKSEILESIVEK